MDANGTAVPSKQYASLGTVHTLLANIYAWMGGLYGKEEYWKKAEEHASLVIDNKVGIYDLEKTVAPWSTIHWAPYGIVWKRFLV